MPSHTNPLINPLNKSLNSPTPQIFCHSTALLSLQNSDSWQVDGNVHVFCIQKNDAGGAVWADLIRESNVDGNRLLRCGEGKLKAGNGRGGVYLVLYHREIR